MWGQAFRPAAGLLPGVDAGHSDRRSGKTRTTPKNQSPELQKTQKEFSAVFSTS
jgi:hypothetical protein